MPVSRRDLLLGLGGGAAGLVFTPAPWKLVDGLAIRSQHRRALPIPPRGEVSLRPAVCSLCPAGCALRVRCYGPRPVSAVADPRHPLAGGCALGLTLHQLAFHPLRLSAPARRDGERLLPISRDAAVAAIVSAIGDARKAGQSVLLLDRRPGRTVSRAWRELIAALPNGVYATPAGEGESLAAFSDGGTPVGIDLERTRTLLSMGAPVLDGWGRPGRLRPLRPGLRVVQVDTWRSPSAGLADEWVPIVPGGEGPLALALVHAIAAQAPVRATAALRDALSGFEPERVAPRVGLEAARIDALARALVLGRPAVAIGGGDAGAGPLGSDAERAIALLNEALESVAAPGGIVPRRPLPDEVGGAHPGARLAEVPAGSVRLAILDAADDGRALPWPALARTLRPDALVVSLSPFDHELSRHAQLLVPVPAPLETYEEALPTADAAFASYGLAAPLLPQPAGATDALALVDLLARAVGAQPGSAPALEAGRSLGDSHQERLARRVAAIHQAARGRWLARDGAGFAEARPADPEAAWQTLVEGGCWIDTPCAPAERALARAPLPAPETLERWRREQAGAGEITLVAFAARGTAGASPVSPLLSKLYQESELRPSVATAALHPRTAAALGLVDRRRVRIASDAGEVEAELRSDPQLPEGRLALAAGPDAKALHPAAAPGAAGALPLAAVEDDGTWRRTRVRVKEA